MSITRRCCLADPWGAHSHPPPGIARKGFGSCEQCGPMCHSVTLRADCLLKRGPFVSHEKWNSDAHFSRQSPGAPDAGTKRSEVEARPWWGARFLVKPNRPGIRAVDGRRAGGVPATGSSAICRCRKNSFVSASLSLSSSHRIGAGPKETSLRAQRARHAPSPTSPSTVTRPPGPKWGGPRRRSIICHDLLENHMKLCIEPELQHHGAGARM